MLWQITHAFLADILGYPIQSLGYAAGYIANGIAVTTDADGIAYGILKVSCL